VDLSEITTYDQLVITFSWHAKQNVHSQSQCWLSVSFRNEIQVVVELLTQTTSRK